MTRRRRRPPMPESRRILRASAPFRLPEARYHGDPRLPDFDGAVWNVSKVTPLA